MKVVRIRTLSLYDQRAIESLISILAPLWRLPEAVLLTFDGCGFVRVEAACLLAGFKLQREAYGLETWIDWGSVKAMIRRQFERWSIAPLFEGDHSFGNEAAIPLLHQPVLRPLELDQYIETAILRSKNMPAMSPALAKRTGDSIFEVVGNTFRHADSVPGCLVVGQFYPEQRRVSLCLLDTGVGIVHRVQESGVGPATPAAAIRWSLEKGTSTRLDGPGGLGLYLLRDFIGATLGILQIYANHGSYIESRGGAADIQMSEPLPGTLIVLTLGVHDGVRYDLARAQETR